jgi:hypothetical protein
MIGDGQDRDACSRAAASCPADLHKMSAHSDHELPASETGWSLAVSGRRRTHSGDSFAQRSEEFPALSRRNCVQEGLIETTELGALAVIASPSQCLPKLTV